MPRPKRNAVSVVPSSHNEGGKVKPRGRVELRIKDTKTQVQRVTAACFQNSRQFRSVANGGTLETTVAEYWRL